MPYAVFPDSSVVNPSPSTECCVNQLARPYLRAVDAEVDRSHAELQHPNNGFLLQWDVLEHMRTAFVKQLLEVVI